MIKIRLRHIENDVDFKQCDATQWEDHAKQFSEKISQKGDAVALVSRNRKLIRFIFGAENIGNDSHVLGKRRAYASMTMRLDRGSWSLLMLKDFCADKGIDITNLPTLAQWLRHPWEGFGERAAAA